jgi:hypothetical protein
MASQFTPTIRDPFIGGKSPESPSVKDFLELIVFKEDLEVTNRLDNATLFAEHNCPLELSV